jgi:hypothetical protein
MNRNFIQRLLPAALFIVLSAVCLPSFYNGFSTKDTYVADPVASTVDLQYNDFGNSDGDDQKISGIPDWLIALPAPRHTTPSPNPAPAPDIAFTVSQARAPPRF